MNIRNAVAALWLAHILMFSSMASAEGLTQCAKNLSVTEKPMFTGLKPAKFTMEAEASTEGGELQVFSDASGRPVYVLITQYGETGRRVALYKLLNGDARSFAARVSDYKYMEPIYVGPPKVVSVLTSSFIVCKGTALEGVGSMGVPEETIDVSNDEVARAVRLFLTGARSRPALLRPQHRQVPER